MTSQTGWLESAATGVAYPPSPWRLSGQLWLTLFRVPQRVDELRPAGVYGAAFVSYQAPSPLTYSELLVARPLARGPRRGRVTITDIWVDSAASAAGGRELWAIPKGLGDFALASERRGPLSTSTWSARADGRAVAAATFRDVSRAAPRTPYRLGLWQPGIADTSGAERAPVMRGWARTLPARARWEIDPDGPVGWLAGARQLWSARMADFRLSFG